MQNTINQALNTDGILANGVANSAINLAAKGMDFAKVFASQSETKNTLLAQTSNKTAQKDTKTTAKTTTKTTTDSRNDVSKNNIDKAQTKDTKTTDTKTKTKDDNKTNKNTQETADTTSKETQKTDDTQKKESADVKSVGDELVKVTKDEVQPKDAETTIKDAMEEISKILESATDGVINPSDLEDLTQVVSEVQTQIQNNEIIVSEDTQKLVEDILDKLTSKDADKLELKALKEDLKQLQEDIKVCATKLNSKEKFDENNKLQEVTSVNTKDEKNIEVNTTNKNVKLEDTTNTDNEKKADTKVLASKNTEEVKTATKSENNIEDIIEQDMLDEMEVKIENVSTSTNTNTQGGNYSSTAQDEIIKLSIQKNNDSQTPITMNFAGKNMNVQGAQFKNINLEAAKELNTSDILNQIGSKFEQLKDGQTTKLTMTLRPSDLGRVTVELTKGANGISTNIIAQNSQVKELLDKNIDILKQQLANQGISVQNIQVKTVESNSETSFTGNFFNQDKESEGGFSQNSSSRQNNQNQRQEARQFEYINSNIIENIDFEGQNSTAQINTAGGKISYNL